MSSKRQHTSPASVSIRQHPSASVSIREHTSAAQHLKLVVLRVVEDVGDIEEHSVDGLEDAQLRQYLYFCTSKASKLRTSRAASQGVTSALMAVSAGTTCCVIACSWGCDTRVGLNLLVV
jgi:hypothetical protein